MKAVLLLGSNLGNKAGYLQFGLYHIEKDLGDILQTSHIYETEAWGNVSRENYLNQIAIINTSFSAEDLLEKIHFIEKEAGRKRIQKWGDRTLDIDILFYDNDIIKTNSLEIPHPQIIHRRFVLEILNELNPSFLHPVYLKKINELLDICEDEKKTTIYLKNS